MADNTVGNADILAALEKIHDLLGNMDETLASIELHLRTK